MQRAEGVDRRIKSNSWRHFRPSKVSSGWTQYEPLQKTSLVYPHANSFRNQEWLAEHDRIEKETEKFDSGELKTLRALTGATQRHLSPEETDIIELTVATIYELDKLLHPYL
ncbi:hypothetical protein P692DRAFT_20881083 [Suillus brevipes Sb2]|nr:hypothetical protein P692DRAFT_20881083 [Suillus brevipes Sb2]